MTRQEANKIYYLQNKAPITDSDHIGTNKDLKHFILTFNPNKITPIPSKKKRNIAAIIGFACSLIILVVCIILVWKLSKDILTSVLILGLGVILMTLALFPWLMIRAKIRGLLFKREKEVKFKMFLDYHGVKY